MRYRVFEEGLRERLGAQTPKGDVGVGREREKEEGVKVEKLASFFGAICEFLSDFKNFEATNFLCNTFPVETPCTDAVGTSSYVPSSSYVVDDVVGIPYIISDDVTGAGCSVVDPRCCYL